MFKNDQERKQFIRDWENWPLWLEVPELGARYRRCDFSDGSAIVVSLYTNKFDYALPHYCIINPDGHYLPHNEGMSGLIRFLRDKGKEVTVNV